MKTRYENGRLCFDVGAFLDDLPAEDKIAFVETLACDDAIIKHVTAQILDGWTESGQHGGILCTASADPGPCNALDYARRQVALRAGEVASKEIQRLEEAVKFHSKNYLQTCDENRELRDQLRRLR